MSCPQCDTETTGVLGQYSYEESGLSRLKLANIPIFRCPKCATSWVEIPRIESLHRLIASVLASKIAKLVPPEIRFLRTYLGLSGKDLAKRMGVSAQIISQWEHGKKNMARANERFLRLMVQHEQPIDHYDLDELDALATEKAKPTKATFVCSKAGWQERMHSAAA